jgi:hypothetical protein
LHYVQVVKRKGIRVSKDQEMIVSLPATFFDLRSMLNMNRDRMRPTPTSSHSIPRSVSRPLSVLCLSGSNHTQSLKRMLRLV